MKTPEQITDDFHAELTEMAHWFGGWDALRKEIDMLEENDNEAAFDRYMERRMDAESVHEQADKMHRIQRI